MKRTILVFTLLFVLMLSFSISYADENIIESPEIKIIIDSKTGVFADVPIISGNRTLLPLRALLTNLGVENENSHIIWNSSERSITIHKDSIRIFLKIGSNLAFVNDAQITLDCAPVIYKNKTYIPTRFVAQSLGKKVIWDEAVKAILIRDEAEFNKVKDIMNNVNIAMNGIKKAKYRAETITRINNADTSAIAAKLYSEFDKNKKAGYTKMEMDVVGVKTSSELYLNDGTSYTKNSSSSNWKVETIQKDQFEKIMDGSSNTNIFNTNDAICAGLSVETNESTHEMVLKGNVYLNELFDRISKNLGFSYQFILEDSYIEMVVDKQTNYASKITINANGSIPMNSSKQKFKMQAVYIYSDIDGAFEITEPQGIK